MVKQSGIFFQIMNESLKYFGTDGIRGRYGDSIINEGFAYSLGVAFARYLEHKNYDKSQPVFLARDTRLSGKNLLLSCQAGLNDNHFITYNLDILPTPVLAFSVFNQNALGGIMVTASHNPHYDNGLKIISAEGGKLEPVDEYLIESFISEFTEHHLMPEIIHQDQPKYIGEYLENLRKYFGTNFLKGLKIVTDLANGATAQITPQALKHFGANVVSINQGDGLINEHVGSEFTEGLAHKVIDEKADLGLAHDGDGDRVVFIDKKGKEVDGDKILGLLAIHAKKDNSLRGNGFVATIHSNSGLASTLKESEIELHRSDVGDRNVFGLMRETGSNWGGESSGHIICSDYMNTGDGLFSALSVLRCVLESQEDLLRLSNRVSLWPSRSVAIKVTSKKPIEDFEELQEFLRKTKETWGEDTRILIRYSGTELKIRVLVEARDEKVADEVFLVVQKLIKKHI